MTALKLDENLSEDLLAAGRAHGHDIESVRSEQLVGSSDDIIFARCRAEGRVLVTLDLDFADPVRFAPSSSAGTIVLRPHRPSMRQIAALFEAALQRLAHEAPRDAIWIVEAGRMRIYNDPE
jgi:predicted nuclease of predicted toxin-antitoxin system